MAEPLLAKFPVATLARWAAAKAVAATAIWALRRQTQFFILNSFDENSRADDSIEPKRCQVLFLF